MLNERNFFWVNHKQTAIQERGNNGNGSEEGYIWSPQRKKDGTKNQFYENLNKVQIGDIIFSYANTKIEFIGIAKSLVIESPKPHEFGNTGDNWDEVGWRVDVDFRYRLTTPFRPKDYMDELIDLLPSKYSPIQNNGNGNQACYLAIISQALGQRLLQLCHADDILDEVQNTEVVNDIENINRSNNIDETEKKRLIDARIGQGDFRKRVLKLYPKCPVTDISLTCVLRASHIRPWRKSNNKERLDAFNGIMLAAHVDALFDKGYISFTDDGSILISQLLKYEIENIGIDINKRILIYEESKPYLKWHREEIFID